MTEKALLQKLRRLSPLIGDDCAVVTTGHPAIRNRDLLFTSDFTIEGVHFQRETPPEAVGHKALARSLSDIAAMGGTPLYCLISLALAPWTGVRWVNGFYRGFTSLLASTRAVIAGGDISHAGQLVCDVTICGSIAHGKALLRTGAQTGDWLYVSGPLGGWKNKPEIVPRLALGRRLVDKATACMDISDGLACDLYQLCRESGVAAELNSIPLLPHATPEQALHDGEDYELLYTARRGVRVPGIRIGSIVPGRPGMIKWNGTVIRPGGYDHLANRTRPD